MFNLKALMCGTLLLLLGPSGFGQCANHAVLSDDERSTFISAAYGTRPEIAVHFLAAKDCSANVLHSLRDLGAYVRFADERVGYALAIMPKEKILDALDLPGIDFASAAIFGIDDVYYYKDSSLVSPLERKITPVPPIMIPYPRVSTMLPKDGPYFAAKEAGLTSLWRQYPEADGRDVRVAMLDEGIDLLHPGLQVATNMKGKLVPKVSDIVVFTNPDEDAGWIEFGEPIRTKDGTFEADHRTWTVPHDGTFRFGIFSKQIYLGDEWLWRLEHDTHIKKVQLSVGVLWEQESKRVWVDTDGDGDFRNQRALGDYAETHDVDYFGSKDGEDDNRIPFGIKIDAAKRAVHLSITDGPHGTWVAGPLAANRLTGGLFDGAAPNAQLIDVRILPTSIHLASALSSFARADVDIVNKSGPFANSYDDAFPRRVLERAIAVYGKPITCACQIAGALDVSDYVSPEMLRRNRDLSPPYAETMNGGLQLNRDGLVNTLLAPSTSLITQSRYMPYVVPWEDGRLHITDVVLGPPAPPGYAIGANPSPTIPVVSGILADLISGAKHGHIRYNAARLSQAVLTGTRLVDGFPAAEQGFGLINAAGAFDQLVKMAGADDPGVAELTSFAVVRLQDGHRTEVNGFQTDLPQPGRTLHGQLWITRRGGYAGGRNYTISLRGNDGTYQVLDHKLTFVRDEPVRVRFVARVTSGFHVAFLQLRDSNAGAVMQEVPLSVRAPDVPENLAPGVEKYKTTIPTLRNDTRYVHLGEDAQAARFLMRIPHDGPGFISLRAMPGFRYGVVGDRFVAANRPPGAAVDAAHHVGPIEEFESLFLNTKPGTQEIWWTNRGGQQEYATPYDDPAPDVAITGTVTVTKYAVAFSKHSDQTLHMTNKLAEIRGKVELYDAKLTSSELGRSGSQPPVTIERTLPSHLSQWRVAVSFATNWSGDVTAFLLDCTGKQGCVVAAQRPVTARGTTLVVDDPHEGEWRIVIWSRARGQKLESFHVREATLLPVSDATPSVDQTCAPGSTRSIPLPAGVSYAAFRIAGTPGDVRQENGLRIAMRPLRTDVP